MKQNPHRRAAQFIRRSFRRVFFPRALEVQQSTSTSMDTARNFEQPTWEKTETPFDRLLSEIEKTALDIYRSNGLPIHRGHYAWSKSGGKLRYIARELTAEQRWEFVMANANKADWRFGTLQDLGMSDPNASPVLHEASKLLVGCHALRTDMSRTGPQSDVLEAAIRLGADWRTLTSEASTEPANPGRTPRETQAVKKTRSRRNPSG